VRGALRGGAGQATSSCFGRSTYEVDSDTEVELAPRGVGSVYGQLVTCRKREADSVSERQAGRVRRRPQLGSGECVRCGTGIHLYAQSSDTPEGAFRVVAVPDEFLRGFAPVHRRHVCLLQKSLYGTRAGFAAEPGQHCGRVEHGRTHSVASRSAAARRSDRSSPTRSAPVEFAEKSRFVRAIRLARLSTMTWPSSTCITNRCPGSMCAARRNCAGIVTRPLSGASSSVCRLSSCACVTSPG